MTTTDKEKLTQLRTDLKGHLVKASKACNVHFTTVTKVLDGKIINHEVLQGLVDYRNELIRTNHAILKQIAS